MTAVSRAIKDYLSLRRRLGFKLRDAGFVLPDFASFLERQGSAYVTTDLAVRWAVQPKDAQPAHWASRLGFVRGFAEYHSATDPRTEIPPKGLLPHCYRRKSPYIYTDEQVLGLIEAARRLPSILPGTTGLRARTYSTLFGLLAATGMRVKSEALALNREDADWVRGVLIIRGTKFGKSRLVPIHPTTRRALRRYARFRDRIHPRPKTRAFFVSERGTRVGYCGVLAAFVRLSRKIGLRGPSDSHGPRMHDLRHRFAIRTLLRWYRKGVDVEKHIHRLSTYLGHVKVADTYWYLTGVPELLQLAMRRLTRTTGGS